MTTINPFSFSAATDLEAGDLLYYYISDHNHSRFIQSKRNIFLLGERGSGKTMTLRFHSLEVQELKAKESQSKPSLDWIGVYVPCRTPLTQRTDHELLDKQRGYVLSEHFLSLSILSAILQALEVIREAFRTLDEGALSEEVEAVLATTLPAGSSFLSRMRRFTAAEARRTQVAINQADEDFYPNAFSFATLVIPMLEALTRMEPFSRSHFLIMLDDADYLNPHQIQAVNSWIAYRDHSRFSFKLATSKVMRPHRITSSGGSIAEGHDFTVVDMENPLHNERSDFGRLARLIIERRLERIKCKSTPEEFFPVGPSVERQLEECRAQARTEAKQKYPNGSDKQISDYVYKYYRAIFFRRRPKANRPVYSGFDMITYLSTGVVRNLLEPCYAMYDKALSRTSDQESDSCPIQSISPTIQSEVILALSERPWAKLEEGLHNHIADCTKKQAEQLKQLFDALARLFRERLLSNCSEPRATSFTISGGDSLERQELDQLLSIARKALLLYARQGPAKAAGARETYYVPSRMLWPARGLDPLGQHARVSLKAKDLMAAARGQTKPWTGASKSPTLSDEQARLFHEES